MTFTKRKMLAAALGAAFTQRGRAQGPEGGTRPASDAGAIAAHIAGRLQLGLDGLVQVYFYFFFVDGVGSDLFGGTPGERTAHFTMRTDLLQPLITANGDAAHLGFQPAAGSEGLYRLYYNSLPGTRDFAKPETFAQGVQIATFRTRRTQATVIPGSHSMASGTADLTSSTPVTFREKTFDIGTLYRSITFEFHSKPLVLADIGVTTISLPVAGRLIKVG